MHGRVATDFLVRGVLPPGIRDLDSGGRIEYAHTHHTRPGSAHFGPRRTRAADPQARRCTAPAEAPSRPACWRSSGRSPVALASASTRHYWPDGLAHRSKSGQVDHTKQLASI